jgi:Zn finger protein HypA/HybF involved in hydrogenase expression
MERFRFMSNIPEYDCPKCDEPIKVRENDFFVVCPQCRTEWRVDVDAEFVDGHWRDLTRLIPSNPIYL